MREFRTRPYLAVGWFWYLGMLIPVIGLVQVGAQARADRYTYLPMVGLSIMLAWGLREVLKSNVAISLAIAACLVCAVLCEAQIQYWRNSETLFRHALDVTSNNYLAYHNLGVALADEGRFAEAIKQYQAALQIEPNAANVQTDYGNALAKSGQMPEAIAHYQAALRALPDSPITHNDLANAFAATPGSMPLAITEYQTALRLKPDYEEARNNLAQVRSNAAKMQYNLGVDLAKSRKPEAAIPHFEEALRLKPDYVDAHNNLGVVLAGAGRVQEAISHFRSRVENRSQFRRGARQSWDCVIRDTRPKAGGHPAFRSGVAHQARPRDPADAGSSRETEIATGAAGAVPVATLLEALVS